MIPARHLRPADPDSRPEYASISTPWMALIPCICIIVTILVCLRLNGLPKPTRLRKIHCNCSICNSSTHRLEQMVQVQKCVTDTHKDRALSTFSIQSSRVEMISANCTQALRQANVIPLAGNCKQVLRRQVSAESLRPSLDDGMASVQCHTSLKDPKLQHATNSLPNSQGVLVNNVMDSRIAQRRRNRNTTN